MKVLIVVPSDKISIPGSGMLKGGKKRRIANSAVASAG